MFNLDPATGAYIVVGANTAQGKPCAWYEAGTTGDADANWIVAAPGGAFDPTAEYVCEVWWDLATKTFTSTVTQGADSASHTSITLDAAMQTHLGVASQVGLGYQRGEWNDGSVIRAAALGPGVTEL